MAKDCWASGLGMPCLSLKSSTDQSRVSVTLSSLFRRSAHAHHSVLHYTHAGFIKYPSERREVDSLKMWVKALTGGQ